MQYAVLLPGDLVDRHRKNNENAERFLREVSEIVPVFYSVGNHERKYRQREAYYRMIRESGVTFLDNESIRFRGICIGGLSSTKGPPDTGFLDRFEREELAARHLLERRGGKDVVHAGHHAVDGLPVADVADVELDLGVLKFVTHVVLFLFVARKDADLLDVAVEEAPQYRVPETAGPAGDEEGFVFEHDDYFSVFVKIRSYKSI